MYIYICIYICIYMYVCMYICIYIYICRTWIPRLYQCGVLGLLTLGMDVAFLYMVISNSSFHNTRGNKYAE
jgi:hypothetical protein